MVGISPFQELPFYVLLQGVEEIGVISNVDGNHRKWFLLRVAMRALFTDLLIREKTPKILGQDLLMSDCFQPVIHTLN